MWFDCIWAHISLQTGLGQLKEATVEDDSQAQHPRARHAESVGDLDALAEEEVRFFI
jgi:hypothetical protein